MATDSERSERIRELKERRMRVAEQKENVRRRAEFGHAVVEKVNAALGSSLTLDDFEVNVGMPIEFSWQRDFRDCSGLVAAHSSEPVIRAIASCCDAISGPMNGVIGFDEYAFVGTARVEAITLAALLELAKSVHDSVLFCPDGHDSIVLLDHYRVSGVPRDEGFSVVIQGSRLETEYARCFAA